MTDPVGPSSLDESYFRDLYAADPDPWRFETSDYEAGKYAETIAALSGRSYEAALEVGCSIGVLTAQLARRARSLTAIDIADAPLARARARNRADGNILFRKAAFPTETPAGPFDLIVLSEVLYYLSAGDLELACWTVLDRLAPGGDVVLVHWLGETPDYPLTGDQAAEGFIRTVGPALTTIRRTRRATYRLDLLRRTPPTP